LRRIQTQPDTVIPNELHSEEDKRRGVDQVIGGEQGRDLERAR
jgi:hypothetical protein